MEDKINIAREKLEITFPLKEKQSRYVSLFLRYKHLKKLCLWIFHSKCMAGNECRILSHDLKFRKQLYLSATYLRGYWKDSENGRVVTIADNTLPAEISVVLILFYLYNFISQYFGHMQSDLLINAGETNLAQKKQLI